MLMVTERKTQKEGLAELLEDGRYSIEFDGGETKELAESTFKRLYTITGEAEQAQSIQEQLEVEKEEEVAETVENEESIDEQLAVEEEELAEESPEEEQPVAEQDAEEVVPDEEDELNALLEGSDEVTDEPAEENKPEPEEPKTPERSVSDLGLNINLIDWGMFGTRGGKTEKVASTISIKSYLMEITEYDGYITDVRLFEENPEAPENDPDAKYQLAYRSPKMSLKDTLGWLGLSAEDMKLARKEITAIRKAVKSAHLEQLAEQEEAEQAQAQEAEPQEQA